MPHGPRITWRFRNLPFNLLDQDRRSPKRSTPEPLPVTTLEGYDQRAGTKPGKQPIVRLRGQWDALGFASFGVDMTKFRLPNNLEDHESRALVEILREHASSFIDWGYDDTNFWVELDAQARNPWPYLLRELFKRFDTLSEQAQMAMAPLVVRMRPIS
jgi:hypothetical protein